MALRSVHTRMELEFEKPDWFEQIDLEKFPFHRLILQVIPYMERFCQRDLTWFHVMVPIEILEQFFENYLPIKENIALLPYTRCCDTFRYLLNDRPLAHKHMLFACKDAKEFLDVWHETLDGLRLERGEKDRLAIELEFEVPFGILLGSLQTGRSTCQLPIDLSKPSPDVKDFVVDRFKTLPHEIIFKKDTPQILSKIKKDFFNVELLRPNPDHDDACLLKEFQHSNAVYNSFKDERWKWFHVMIPHDTVELFFEAMYPFKEKTIIAPVTKRCETFHHNLETIHHHMVVGCENTTEMLEAIHEIISKLEDVNENQRMESIRELNEYETFQFVYGHLANVDSPSQCLSTCDS